MPPVAERDRVRDHVLALAKRDERVVAAAVTGSLAMGGGDAWSDLDLTFGVRTDVPVAAVIEDWTRDLAEAFDAVPILDLDAGQRTYRVFMLASWLQVDLSFAQDTARQAGAAFRAIFGPHEVVPVRAASAQAIFGWAVLYARHARVTLAREQWWQAEYCISGLRDHALALACLRRELPTDYGKGFDRLPPHVLRQVESAFPRSLEPDESGARSPSPQPGS